MASRPRSPRTAPSPVFASTPTRRALAAGILSHVPVMIMGNPGVTKTATICGAAAKWGFHTEVLIGASREPTDYLGNMMTRTDGTTGYADFRWARALNDAEKGLLVLDEFNLGKQGVMAAQQRLVQERYVGETKLKPSVSIVMISNPLEVAPEANELSPAMANRVMHLDWEFDAEMWLNNVGTGFKFVEYDPLEKVTFPDPETNRVTMAATVTTFLRIKPELLAPQPPSSIDATVGWPSPRSWTNVIDVLAYIDRRDLEATSLVVRGLVGEAARTVFMQWRETLDLHDPMAVMADPSIVDWKDESPDRLYFLTDSVTSLGLIGKAYWRDAVNVMVACAASGMEDIAEAGASRLLNNMPEGVTSIPSGAVSAFSSLLERMEYGITTAAA